MLFLFTLSPLPKHSRFSQPHTALLTSRMVTIEISDGSDFETTPQLVKPPNFKPAQRPRIVRPVPPEYYSQSKGATVVMKAVEDPYKARDEDPETVSSRKNNTSYQTSRLSSASSSNRWEPPGPVHKQVLQLNRLALFFPLDLFFVATC